MIAKIEGEVSDIGLQNAIIMISGIGYKVFLINQDISSLSIGQNIALFTHHVIRENSQDLYGFVQKSTLEFFELLLTVSGIGPKSALGILNSASVETLTEGISSGDAGHLSKISGLGKKSAEKIVIGLKDKIGSVESTTGSNLSETGMALEALISLGYSEREARESVNKSDKSLSTEEIVKEALKNLGNQK